MHQSVHHLRLGQWTRAGFKGALDESAQSVEVGCNRSEKLGLTVRRNQQGRKVVHLDRVDQVGFVFNIDPHKLGDRKFRLQLQKRCAVVLAGSAPLGAQQATNRGGGKVLGSEFCEVCMAQ